MFRKDLTEAVLFLQHLTGHKGTLKHACFLNIDATNGGCHYVSVRMCERESHPGSPPAPVPLQSLSDDCICPFAPLLSSRPV